MLAPYSIAKLISEFYREESGLAIVLYIHDFNGLNLHTDLTKVCCDTLIGTARSYRLISRRWLTHVDGPKSENCRGDFST
jgi:hypothetical protein